MPTPSISVTLITKNEASNIEACLQSVSWADELIVVDSGSSDQTVAMARSLGAKVFETADWPGFGVQKNRALQHATSDWVLSIDADERVSPELAQEIQKALAQNADCAYASPRLTFFLGKAVRHCGWYPDYSPRLFKRGRGRFSDHLVHEGLLLDDPIRRFKSDLLHYSYRTQQDVDKKIAEYGLAGAQQMALSGKHVWPLTPTLKAAWAWFRTLTLRGGLLDGTAGLRIARMNAKTTWTKYSISRAQTRLRTKT